jgi:hypothetical protein
MREVCEEYWFENYRMTAMVGVHSSFYPEILQALREQHVSRRRYRLVIAPQFVAWELAFRWSQLPGQHQIHWAHVMDLFLD